MNGYKDGSYSCYFHPKQQVIGVCPLCLNDRLLLLASKQPRHSSSSSSSSTRGSHGFIQGFSLKKPPINKLPKIFALGSLLNRLEFKHWKPGNSDDDVLDVSTSQEDSFISIKFEENGVGSWENGKVSKGSIEHCSKSWNPTLTKGITNEPKVTNKTVIEHAKPRALLKWRKRIGHLSHLIKWKRSSKANVRHMGSKVNGINLMGKGWIRTLTKRTKE
ncbi:hypothetical protein E1A91_D02G097000v1 [Gossypium mustelinum]|uniref:Uncharacterized protein n=3 Tax=Gossypium TaxID=3633 RepID=A0A5J5SCG4_GOSBA|nr:hypothetical protein ES319_D02G092100v1 [Gossypium barbadense]TYG78906.1 hypothetical protein ES288_D02G098800v1 [Gossypium darwinii]TYI92820.1 hypothetical protein E1A91_D02G097000v1 [Gossypium mustelinum]